MNAALALGKRTGWSWRRVLPWLAPVLFLALFFFYPLGSILWLGLHSALLGGELDSILPPTVRIFSFTLYQALLSTLLTLVIGLPSAFLFAKFTFRSKASLRLLTAIPFMLPTVVVAAGFNALLGGRGWINLLLMRFFSLASPPIPFLGTLGAILLAHVFYNTTIVIRLVGNALAHLDPRLEQAARTLGANSRGVFWKVTLPLLRVPVLAATLLVFLFDFTSFGVILLLGGARFSTLEVAIYLQATQLLNLPLAALLSLVQLGCTLVFSILYSRLITRRVASGSPSPADPATRSARSWQEKLFVGGVALLLVLLFVLPMVSLPLRSVTRLEADRGEHGSVQYGLTGDYYLDLFQNPSETIFYVPPFAAIGNSLLYATLTVILSLLLGFPAASALARPTRLEKVLDPFFLLPLGASAVTLGLGFIVTFNRPPLTLVASPWLVPLAHTLVALPFVIRILQPALASIPDRLRQAAASLGAPAVRVWLTVEWPIASRAALSAAVFAFTISLGEFGASSLVVRPEYPTLPIAIARFLSQPGASNYGQAMAMATILMAVCAAGILMIERLRFPGMGEF